MRRLLLLLAVALAICPAKDRTWIAGRVVTIEEVEGRVMQTAPAQNYVVDTGSAVYTLEHAARTYYTKPPKALVSVGDKVDLALQGKNAILKTPTTEKKLRIIKTSRH